MMVWKQKEGEYYTATKKGDVSEIHPEMILSDVNPECVGYFKLREESE